MIRIVAGIAVCIAGVVVLGFAVYFGWVQDAPRSEPVVGQLYGTFSMVFAIFSVVLIGSGGFHVVRSIRRINRQDRRRRAQSPSS